MSKEAIPDKLADLIAKYLGDDSWENFAKSFDVDEVNVNEIADEFNISNSTARVLEWHIRKEYVKEWFNTPNPALSNFRPLELIERFRDGEVCIRVILRRMK